MILFRYPNTKLFRYLVGTTTLIGIGMNDEMTKDSEQTIQKINRISTKVEIFTYFTVCVSFIIEKAIFDRQQKRAMFVRMALKIEIELKNISAFYDRIDDLKIIEIDDDSD